MKYTCLVCFFNVHSLYFDHLYTDFKAVNTEPDTEDIENSYSIYRELQKVKGILITYQSLNIS